MNHSAPVGVAQRVSHLAGDTQRVVERQLLLAVQPVSQRLALDQRHGIEEEAIGLARVEQRQDVRVPQIGRGLDLAQKPFRPQRLGQFRPQHLDRHLAVVLEVLGEVDCGHAPAPELTLDRVSIGERCMQFGEKVGHHELPHA